jgi:hypothetical protein
MAGVLVRLQNACPPRETQGSEVRFVDEKASTMALNIFLSLKCEEFKERVESICAKHNA